MDAKEILTSVRQLFNELTGAATATPPATPDAPTATEYELKDGGKVMIDKLEAGGVVMIDGSPSLPGDIELADGTKITVGDNGVISAVTPGASANAPGGSDAPADMGAKFSAFEELTNQKFASYETKFSAYEQRFADYEVKMAKANKVIEELLKLSQLIVDAPAPADPATRTNNTFIEEKPKRNLDILFN